MAASVRHEISLQAAGLAALAGCALLFGLARLVDDTPHSADPVTIAGGGFVANYRVSEIFAGFTAFVVKPVASGSILEATFEDPAGGPPITVSERFRVKSPRIVLRTPALHDVVRDRPYAVDVRLLSYDRSEEFWHTSMTFRSQVGSDMIADKPLTVGPGYMPNPELKQP
ncbi:hypothetical protein CSC94_19135 [Zhengella mangrovi]|uniref:Uncharacterized protein n=1 Tax=Zhengella mangrovi TaxID=1982044 RepID=A0A2G1QJ33_9HYPH|nr:hypothetical protein [Zhengella mangrovi]PHP65470.1 hypothetical protein CSC94_19135 [Zhengella mangrovi]